MGPFLLSFVPSATDANSLSTAEAGTNNNCHGLYEISMLKSWESDPSIAIAEGHNGSKMKVIMQTWRKTEL
jgi:hypothetical protein